MAKCRHFNGKTQLYNIIEVSEYIICPNTLLAEAGHLTKLKVNWTERHTSPLKVELEEEERIFIEKLNIINP